MFKLLLCILLLPMLGFAQNVFVWDYDNNYTCTNLDTDEEWGIQQGVVEALQANGISPVVQTILPANLSNYDIVFVICGIWCGT